MEQLRNTGATPGTSGAPALPVTCAAGMPRLEGRRQPQGCARRGYGDAMTTANSRSTDYPIDPLFLQRWSPRSFTAAPISEYDLMTILEAARWAPSAFNSQPWRFIYARRDTAHWPKLLGLLTQSNQLWAKNASALISALVRQKPSTAKGTYLRSITVSSTMGPGVKIDTEKKAEV